MTNEHKLEPVAYLHICRKKPAHKSLMWKRDVPFLKQMGYKPEPLVTIDQAEAHCAALRQALHDLVRDLEMRSKWKEGSSHGAVDCGNGVYMKAKAALGEL